MIELSPALARPSVGSDVITEFLLLPSAGPTGATGVVSGRWQVSVRLWVTSGLMAWWEVLNSISEPGDIK